MSDATGADAPIRVLIVDDQALVRSGFSMMLSADDDIAVVGEVANGELGVAAARELRPDVILMDVQMPVMDGIEATRAVVAEDLGRVIILTTFDRDDYLFDALRAGASGFLLKNSEPEQLVEAIRSVAGGNALLAPEVTTRVIAAMVDGGAQPVGAVAGGEGGVAAPAPAEIVGSPEELGRLTEREREVLVLMGQGRSNAEIAAELFLGEATVKTHVSSCLAKLHLRDRVQAVVFAHQQHLVATR
ncbi:LuxR family two component transcriptional regulator [Knoellia remsis]|uniref:LuxR family two component transcriptional regulator n=1 Tax=Knoellia remsis TaxID=407159 RepID=A0A2T0UCQ3_9MICO|nr:response regulator transcription factor [Knoellia remsis]PRY55648.1 LuxR family two component transcriptional regulator [Knoellia remsis]